MNSVGGVLTTPIFGMCAPVDMCQLNPRNGAPSWTLSNVAAPMTITYTNIGPYVVDLFLNTGAGCADTSCPAHGIVNEPTQSVAVSYIASSDPVTPGSTLHVQVIGSTDVGPVSGLDLQAKLGPGLDTPTAVAPATAIFSPPPYDYIDDGVTIDPGTPAVLSFDTVVTAASGTDVTIIGNVWRFGALAATTTRTIHVGLRTSATYVPLAPARVLDTRYATGLSGVFASGVARTFPVTGRGGVPANAVAVTGTLTVTAQTRAGYVALGPVATNTPSTSTLNVPAGDTRANGVTVALGAGGTLSATYITGRAGDHTALLLDITGYFMP
jgi:hypothetical protein